MKDLNIFNFRDISGYVNKYGETMKPNLIFRGGSLDHISLEDAKYMEEELGITYILDYRDNNEANDAKDIQFPHARYERISALKIKKYNDDGFDFGSMLKEKITRDRLEFLIKYLKEGYKTMPFDNSAYKRLFELLLEDSEKVYFHCSAGKDRTGVSAFLIMMALGMSEEDGIKEYLLSNQYLKGFIEDFYVRHHIPEELRKECDALLLVNKEYLMCAIKSIKEKYKNYDEYFEKEYGLNKEKKELLRAKYCQ